MLRVLPALFLVAAAALAGCANTDEDRIVEGSTLTIYAGLPLEGPEGEAGNALLDGAKLALAEADGRAGEMSVVATYLGNTQGDPPKPSRVQAARNGRRASQDVRTIAYLGDLSTTTTRVSLPISNQAGIAHVSPGATGPELTRAVPGVPKGAPERYYPTAKRNFARVVPNDLVQVGAVARLAEEAGDTVWVVGRLSPGFGRITGRAFTEAARDLGVRTVGADPAAGGPQGTAEGQARVIADAKPDSVFFANEDPTPDLARLVRAVAERVPDARLLATDALLHDRFLRQVGTAGRQLKITSPFLPVSELGEAGGRFAERYREEFGSAPAPHAAYGYEGMRLLLDAIKRAGKDGANRDSVIETLLATRSRTSVLGRYSVDGDGDTTLNRIAAYEVREGRAVFDRVLKSGPRG